MEVKTSSKPLCPACNSLLLKFSQAPWTTGLDNNLSCSFWEPTNKCPLLIPLLSSFLPPVPHLYPWGPLVVIFLIGNPLSYRKEQQPMQVTYKVHKAQKLRGPSLRLYEPWQLLRRGNLSGWQRLPASHAGGCRKVAFMSHHPHQTGPFANAATFGSPMHASVSNPNQLIGSPG